MLTLFLALISFKSKSQDLDKGKIFDNWSLSINGGVPMFWGDVESTLSDKIKVNAAWGIKLAKRFNSTFELRGEFLKGSVGGIKPAINRYFNSDFYDFDISGTINFSQFIYGENPCRKFNFYGILGLGLFNYRSILYEYNTNNIIAHSGYKSIYPGTSEEYVTEAFLAVGIGISYRLDKRFDLVAENQWHVVNTDLVDNKVGWFSKDVVSYTSLGITYKFNFRKNPGLFVDCAKGGTTKGKLDDGATYRYDTTGKTVIINKCCITKDSVNNIINESNKIKDIDNKIKELQNQKNNLTPANTNPVANNINSDKLKELENKIKDLENQKNNAAPANNNPVANNINSDKLKELENKIKDLENQKNNAPANNNVTPVQVQNIDQDALRKSILKQVMDSINNLPKPKTITTTTSSTSVSVDNLSLQPVYFAFNKSIIRESELSKIENIAQIMSTDKNLKIIVFGHCDRYGTEPYNDGLSKRRAKAVARMLTKKYKISKDRIKVEYDGKKNLISPANAINRRVDFTKQN